MKKFLIGLSIIVLLISCKHTQQIETPETNKLTEDTTTVAVNESKIMFLVLTIFNDSIKDENHISLISKSASSGKIKQVDESAITSENYLTFKVYEKNKLVTTVVKTHPLYKDIEYQNDNHELSTKHIELKKEDFFIRLQINSPSVLKIFEKRKDKPEQLLTTIDL